MKCRTTFCLLGVCQSQWSTSRGGAVRLGSTATFTCHSAYEITCFIYGANISDTDITEVCREGYDDKFIDRCTAPKKNAEGTYTLTISRVQLSDAGFYGCRDCIKMPSAKPTARLLVLGESFISHNVHINTN